MKKCLFACTVLAALLSACQSHVLRSDKTQSEIGQSVESFRDQISFYQHEAKALKERNVEIGSYLASGGKLIDSVALIRERERNSAKIVSYEGKADRLAEQVDEFLAESSGKARRSELYLQGDAEEVANALAIVNSTGNTRTQNDTLKGVVVNEWYNSVVATVKGPGNFTRIFNLSPRSQSPVFLLPAMGRYCTTFSTSLESKSIVNRVGPNIVYFDAQKRPYDYMAILPSR